MKLELNVVRMANEDVIATSSTCANTTLYEYDKGKGKLKDCNNGGDVIGQFSSNLLPNESGYYHFENGKFVTCPTWNGNTGSTSNDQEVYMAHGAGG